MTNYETHTVGMWFNNDEGSYRYWTDLARESWETHHCDPDESDEARDELAEQMEEEFDSNNPLSTDASAYSDMLSSSLREIDWTEIADDFLSECDGFCTL